MRDWIPYNGTQCSGDNEAFLEMLVIKLEFKSILIPSNILLGERNAENDGSQGDFAISALEFKDESVKNPLITSIRSESDMGALTVKRPSFSSAPLSQRSA